MNGIRNWLELQFQGKVASSIRVDCPSCGGGNTFSAVKRNGTILYRCFRASCKLHGAADYGMSAKELRDFHYGITTVQEVFELPDYFLPVAHSTKALEFLQKNNCMEAFTAGHVKLRYDPKQDRVVFLIPNDRGEIANAIGKALTLGIKPKWYKYANKDAIFVCPGDGSYGHADHCIVVEDPASACAVFHFGTGVALNGTYLSKPALSYIASHFKSAVVALDYDASQKALGLTTVIGAFMPAKTALLKRDLKYLSHNEIKEILQ